MSDPKYIITPPPDAVERMRPDQYLDEAHQAVFDTAISNILAIEIAEITFAQNGLPLKEVAFSIEGYGNTIHDPVFKHETLCPGAVDRATQYRGSYDTRKMDLEDEASCEFVQCLRDLDIFCACFLIIHALYRFKILAADCRASHLAFMELVARAIHRKCSVGLSAG